MGNILWRVSNERGDVPAKSWAILVAHFHERGDVPTNHTGILVTQYLVTHFYKFN